MARNHAHFQIQYRRDPTDNERMEGQGRQLVETLRGFDPRDPEQRKFIHDNLDEFLDFWIIPKLNQADGINPNKEPSFYKDTVNKEAEDHLKNYQSEECNDYAQDQIQFKIFGEVDCH